MFEQLIKCEVTHELVSNKEHTTASKTVRLSDAKKIFKAFCEDEKNSDAGYLASAYITETEGVFIRRSNDNDDMYVRIMRIIRK